IMEGLEPLLFGNTDSRRVCYGNGILDELKERDSMVFALADRLEDEGVRHAQDFPAVDCERVSPLPNSG
ncbi:MAG: hypothetical protein ACOVS5_02660, partial [Oligoflexus sp.]